MPNLGVAEILVIFVVALIVFGPNRLPEIGRQVGKAFRELRQMQDHLRGELDDVLGDLDPSRPTEPASLETGTEGRTPDGPEDGIDHEHGEPVPATGDTEPPQATTPGATTQSTAPGAGRPMPSRFRPPRRPANQR